jgi:hypothetical protein
MKVNGSEKKPKEFLVGNLGLIGLKYSKVPTIN